LGKRALKTFSFMRCHERIHAGLWLSQLTALENKIDEAAETPKWIK